LVKSLGPFKYTILLSVSRVSLTSSFINIPFISFSCFIVLAKNSTLYWRIGESRYPCLFDFLRNSFQFSPFSVMLLLDLLYIAFIMLRYYPLLWVPLGLSSWRNVEFLSQSFSVSVEVIMWLLSLILFMCCIMFIDLHILKHLCIHGIKPNWTWCMIILICCWIHCILLRFFSTMLISKIGLFLLLLLLCLYPGLVSG
jgi:hypothetical protein